LLPLIQFTLKHKHKHKQESLQIKSHLAEWHKHQTPKNKYLIEYIPDLMKTTSNIVRFITISGLLISGVSIPISTAGQNIGAALLIISFLLISKNWPQIRKISLQPFAIAGLFMGFILAIGTTWSSASPVVAWGFFLKMRAYYLIPVFLTIINVGKMRNYVLLGFVIVTSISIILSCAAAWLNYPLFMAIPGDWYIFRTHTYHNFFAALLGIMLLSVIILKKIAVKHKIILFLIFLLISYDILFLVAGRTGQIVYLLMIGLTLILWNWRLGLVTGIIIAASLTIILPKYSTAFNTGLNNAASNLSEYSNGNSNTSIGLRLEWQKNSINLIKERPLLGHGTGSFKGEYARILGSGDQLLSSQNPHNDYLWLGVELGIFGTLSLIALLLAAAWQGRQLQPAWKWTLYSLLLGMGVSTLANSFFTDNITGLAFVLLTCALLSGPVVKGKIA
jgi:O-antigen ligase